LHYALMLDIAFLALKVSMPNLVSHLL
jgi:hypothetical protein